MEPMSTVTGVVAPLDRANVDTDAIIPKQFLKSVERTGFGEALFYAWRFEGDSGRARADFVLNQPAFRDATILLARENFGCGSSREHAVWALAEFGIRVVVATSFADIFRNNATKNGLLTVALNGEAIDGLFARVRAHPGMTLSVELEPQRIVVDAATTLAFDIDENTKSRLVQGLDDIALTQRHARSIDAYEARRRDEAPWLFRQV